MKQIVKTLKSACEMIFKNQFMKKNVEQKTEKNFKKKFCNLKKNRKKIMKKMLEKIFLNNFEKKIRKKIWKKLKKKNFEKKVEKKFWKNIWKKNETNFGKKFWTKMKKKIALKECGHFNEVRRKTILVFFYCFRLCYPKLSSGHDEISSKIFFFITELIVWIAKKIDNGPHSMTISMIAAREIFNKIWKFVWIIYSLLSITDLNKK